ncbi:hypothetical protein BMA10247_A0410 [Burkholderia mallei NCTC 10247]|nr:hypothetical protein BMA10247_A0410 [Burkholderia mallei NCTC 10247]
MKSFRPVHADNGLASAPWRPPRGPGAERRAGGGETRRLPRRTTLSRGRHGALASF